MKKYLTLLLLFPFFVPTQSRCITDRAKMIAAATIAGVGVVSTVGYLVYKWWTKTPKPEATKEEANLWQNVAEGLSHGQRMQLRSFLGQIPSFDVFSQAISQSTWDEKLCEVRAKIDEIKHQFGFYTEQYKGLPIAVCLKDLETNLLVINGEGSFKQFTQQLGDDTGERTIESHMKYAQSVINHLLKQLA